MIKARARTELLRPASPSVAHVSLLPAVASFPLCGGTGGDREAPRTSKDFSWEEGNKGGDEATVFATFLLTEGEEKAPVLRVKGVCTRKEEVENFFSCLSPAPQSSFACRCPADSEREKERKTFFFCFGFCRTTTREKEKNKALSLARETPRGKEAAVIPPSSCSPYGV